MPSPTDRPNPAEVEARLAELRAMEFDFVVEGEDGKAAAMELASTRREALDIADTIRTTLEARDARIAEQAAEIERLSVANVMHRVERDLSRERAEKAEAERDSMRSLLETTEEVKNALRAERDSMREVVEAARNIPLMASPVHCLGVPGAKELQAALAKLDAK